MSLTINNDSAIGFALVALNRSSNLMNEAMERLSTGKRINKASDDPAGIHRVMRLNAEIQGIKTASRNAADGQHLHKGPKSRVFFIKYEIEMCAAP